MLISEEEVPFKDDPRDETYRPHLEKYSRLCTYCVFRPKKPVTSYLNELNTT